VAENLNATNPDAMEPAQVAEPPTPATPKKKTRVSALQPIIEKILKYMNVTFWHILGLVIILFAIMIKKFNLLSEISRSITHLPYLIAGIGLFCLGKGRNMVRNDYVVAYKQDRQFPHYWKVPLLSGQFILLLFSGLYALAVGVNLLTPVHNPMVLTFFLILFSLYFLWYLIAHLSNRFPSFASFRVSILALFLAVAAFALWVYFQLVLVSIVFALFAVITLLVSLYLAATSKLQLGAWPRFACLVATVVFLLPVGLNAFAFGKPHSSHVGLELASSGIEGMVIASAYSQDGSKIAFCQKTSNNVFLQVVNLRDKNAVFKIQAGEDAFKPVFINNGKYVLIDALKGGKRELWKVDATNGSIAVLKTGIQSIENGAPWFEKTKKFLFVNILESGSTLNVMDLSTLQTKELVRLNSAIRTPSWSFSGDKVVFADGVSGLPYTYDVATSDLEPVISSIERPEMAKLLKGPAVQEVLPAPDGFRYLYLTLKDNVYTFWEVRTDGTNREIIHEVQKNSRDFEIRNIMWFPNGQRFIFVEKMRRNDFHSETDNIILIDANLGTVETLLPTQISTRSPSISPSGVNIAFSGTTGLWYPSIHKLIPPFDEKTGLWVARLR
jgi:Tol biopolymer transport system component